MVAAVATFAAGINNIREGQQNMSVASQVTLQGKHCRGTVGCDCPGFEPLTKGTIYEKTFCRHCGHNKSYH